MRRIVSAVGIAVVLLAAVVIATALGAPRAAVAQGTEEPDGATQEAPPREGPASLGDILSDLVDENVITQDQADRIEAEIRERAGGHFGRWHHGLRGPEGFAKPDIASILGLTPEELRDAFAEGKTLGEIADETEGVTRQDVIDALVDAGNERIDAALEDGRITEDRAADLRERLEQRAEDLVDGELPKAGFRRHGLPGRERPGFGPFGPHTGEDAGTI